jgi:hypothetical protein
MSPLRPARSPASTTRLWYYPLSTSLLGAVRFVAVLRFGSSERLCGCSGRRRRGEGEVAFWVWVDATHEWDTIHVQGQFAFCDLALSSGANGLGGGFPGPDRHRRAGAPPGPASDGLVPQHLAQHC